MRVQLAVLDDDGVVVAQREHQAHDAKDAQADEEQRDLPAHGLNASSARAKVRKLITA